MHYYKLNIPTWNLSTAHLSLVEEAIYFRLVNHYYDTEQPIPLETHSVIRRLRLASHEETVGLILAEYFTETKKGFVHSRCEELLNEYAKTTGKNRANGKKGGRPKKNKDLTGAEAKPTGLFSETQTEPNNNPNQEPLTNNQEPTTASRGKPPVPPCPVAQIIDCYKSIAQRLPAVRVVAEATEANIRARWLQDPKFQNMKFWEGFFNYCENNNFLSGQSIPRDGKPPFRASLAWVVLPQNFAKIINETYSDEPR